MLLSEDKWLLEASTTFVPAKSIEWASCMKEEIGDMDTRQTDYKPARVQRSLRGESGVIYWTPEKGKNPIFSICSFMENSSKGF